MAGRETYVPNEIIVKLKSGPTADATTRFIGRAVTMRGMNLRNSWRRLNMYRFRLAPGEDVLQKINELEQNPAVAYAEPNFIVYKSDIGPVMNQQTYAQGLVTAQSSGSGYGLSDAPIDATQAWSIESSGSQTTTVAVIDTGIDFSHTVFTQSGAIWTNPGETGTDQYGHDKQTNGIDDDGNGYVDDVHGWNFVANNNDPQDDNDHGTHVSGIILGTTEDIFTNPVAAAKIRIMPLKFLASDGSGTVADAISAIYYAVNNGAKVLNNSWGGPDYSQALVDAISYAYSKKDVFVVAAGNNATDNDNDPIYPANYNVPSLIAVAASTDTDQLASFSDFGFHTVEVGSPGLDVFSTLPGNTFGYLSGTSMATPFVSGIAALMAREAPTMTGYQIKQLIMQGSDQDNNLQNLVSTGARINVYSALRLSQTTPVDPNQPNYVTEEQGTTLASAAPAGCGLVTKLATDFGGGDDGFGGAGASPFQVILFLLIMLMPVGAYLVMRATMTEPENRRRKYDRFRIESSVRIRVGDRELVGNVSSISLGGLKVDTEALLSKGGTVMLAIRSPDGNEEIQAEGRIVWSEENRHYGIQFCHAQDSVKNTIQQWTQKLAREPSF